MISKKIENLGQFTIILSLGSIISCLMVYFFRFIALLLLINNDYGLFVITIRTFSIVIPFSSYGLGFQLTREIRAFKNETDIEKLFQNFAFSYSLTSLFSFFLFIIISFYFLNFINISLIIFLAFSLIFYSFSLFFISLSNGYIMPIKGQIILIIGNLVPILFALISIFVRSFRNVNDFLFFFGIGYLCSFLVGLYFYKAETRKYLFSNNLIDKNMIKENIKNSLFIISTTFIKNLKYWIISVFAFSLLTDLSFKIFDLSLMIISVIDIVASSLTTAINAKKDLKELNTKNFLKKSFIPFLILIILLEIFLFFTNLDIILLNIIFREVPNETKIFLRISLLIVIPLIISSFFGGKILNKRKYSSFLISNILGFITSLILYILALYYNLVYLLLVGLFLEIIIFSLFLIIFDHID